MQVTAIRTGVGFGLLFLVLFASFAFVTPTYAATKKTEAVSTPDPLKDATVNLYCIFNSGNKRFSSTGSGVFISERGVILTNAHVAQYFLLPHRDGKVRGQCTVRTGSPARNTYEASVLYMSPTWLATAAASSTGSGERDFALLYVTDTTKGPFPTAFPKLAVELNQTPRQNEAVSIAGYSTHKLSFNKIRTKLNVITASSTVTALRNFATAATADILTIAYSPASASGMSGGPVVNTQGKVVGLATAVSTGDKEPLLRAVTVPYANRVLMAETGLPLSYYLLTNFEVQGAKMQASVATSTLKVLKDSLFKKK